jgi:hypothetical protein
MKKLIIENNEIAALAICLWKNPTVKYCDLEGLPTRGKHGNLAYILDNNLETLRSEEQRSRPGKIPGIYTKAIKDRQRYPFD